MNAAESRQSPAMVDIWFLKVSLVFSQRSRSADRLFRRAVLRLTCGGGDRQMFKKKGWKSKRAKELKTDISIDV